MGKPKTHSKKAKKLAKKKGLPLTPQAGPDLGKYSIDEILDKADTLIEEYNYDLAKRFLERALELNSDHPRALESAASLLLEGGEVEKAKQCLGRAVTVQPNEGHSKFFSLAQLFEGQESLQLYRQGIKIIESSSSTDADSSEKETKKELSNAYCAIAELYMTDLCDEDVAEKECEDCIRKSVEACDENPEAWQTKARLHLIRSEFKESKKALDKSLSLWLPNYMAVLENRPEEASASFDPVEVCPLLYTTRLATARMLIELEEWDKAVQVLDGLIEEDDTIVDSWYLLGWVNKLRAVQEKEENYNGNARYYLNRAKEIHKKNPTKDVQMVGHIDELLEELGPEPEHEAAGDGENGEAEDDDWEDVDDEAMEES